MTPAHNPACCSLKRLLPIMALVALLVGVGFLAFRAAPVGANRLHAAEGDGKAPELEGGEGWLNTARPVKMADLKGKIVLLDFWTYCCINCIHTLPDLAKLEKKYENELVVIGVHSAKFDNEKESQNILKAINRYGIKHPVVNDAKMKIWDAYGVSSWPTLILIDPDGQRL